MKRRDIIAGLLVSTVIRHAQAQQSGKVYRIAILDPASPVEIMNESAGPEWPLYWSLFKGLRSLGYVEGLNLTVERYSGRANYSPDLARKAVSTKPDLIFGFPSDVLRDLRAATDTIPIVGILTFPADLPLIASVARPGGNLTGVSATTGPEVFGKRLALLREMIPRISRVGWLGLRGEYERRKPEIDESAREVGLTLIGPFLERPVTDEEIHRVLAAMSQEAVEALYVTEPAEIWIHMRLVIRLAQDYRLPTFHWYRYWAQVGGLMAYDYGTSDLGGIAAGQIDQILKGTKPGDIPIYQPQKFTLSINIKTAKAIGVTVPTALLASADEVIE